MDTGKSKSRGRQKDDKNSEGKYSILFYVFHERISSLIKARKYKANLKRWTGNTYVQDNDIAI